MHSKEEHPIDKLLKSSQKEPSWEGCCEDDLKSVEEILEAKKELNMVLYIKRHDKMERFEVSDTFKGATLLELLNHIKQSQDKSLSFLSGCRSGVCGSCAVRVNGKEVLACAYKVASEDKIEPLRNMPLLKDLVVDYASIEQTLKRTQAHSDALNATTMSQEDLERIETQSDCILCASCYSACPVLAVDAEFLGPFALTKAWRYVNDSRQIQHKGIIEAVQHQGIWDCTLCNECVPVCPQGIAPKQDIEMLQAKSGILGFMNPNFGGGLDFTTPLF